MCGSASDPSAVATLMNGQHASVCVTSPPYAQQRHYKAAILDWDALMQSVFLHLPMAEDGQVLVNLGLIHRDYEWQEYWADWVHWMRTQGWRRFGWYVWDKGHGLPGQWNGRLAPSFEFIFHFNRISRTPNKTIQKKSENVLANSQIGQRFKNGTTLRASHTPEAGLNTHKIADDVLRIAAYGYSRKTSRTFIDKPSASTVQKISDDVIRTPRHCARGIECQHPAVFPVELARQLIAAYSQRNEIIYEPFAGSGSTLVAAEREGRICYAMEISPEYCQLAIKRIERDTGLVAVPDGAPWIMDLAS